MPVFVKDNVAILYVHVPKTGGTSIETFFVENGFYNFFFGQNPEGADVIQRVRRCSPQHMQADLLRRMFRLREFKYIFMTVRNPYTRVMSEYTMRKVALNEPRDFSAWFLHAAEQYARDEHAFDNHMRPQTHFLLKSAEVFKQEDGIGPAWIEQVERKTGLAFANRNVGQHQHFTTDPHDPVTLDPTIRSRINELYKADFERFGYDML